MSYCEPQIENPHYLDRHLTCVELVHFTVVSMVKLIGLRII